ncbi:MAG TPA: hypothetical protein VKD26_06770 [Streptosporangiaceae bacterium]|nr:hypothetical protein [Streptosporangiaceae bacterium]
MYVSLGATPATPRSRPGADEFRPGRGADGAHHAHSVQVGTVADGGIARMVAFQEPSLFATFGLPPTFPTAPARPGRQRRGSQVL